MKKENIRIDKNVAAQFLERNEKNCRPATKPHVEQLASMMRRGEWVESNPSPIAFDVDGYLRNGQHRLLAIILSGAVISFPVVWDATEEFLASLDGCIRPKKIHEVVPFFETRVCNRICGYAVNSFAQIVDGKYRGTNKATPSQAREIFQEWKHELEYVVPRIAKVLELRRGAVVHALAEAIRVDPERGRAFVESFIQPAGQILNATLLRDYILRNRDRGGNEAIRGYGFTVYSAGNWFKGVSIAALNKRARWTHDANIIETI